MTKDEIIELTKELVKFKSTKGRPDELKFVVNFAADYLGKYGLVKRFEFNGKPSLVATYTDTKSPDIFIVGHLDVVEAPDDQFTAAIKEDKMHGRGAVDMKGGDAVAMVLFKELAQMKPSLGIMLTTDEEIGGLDGVGELAKEYKCKFAIAPEPNHPKEPGQLNITIKHKGTLWIKIKTKGTAAHASRPWLGDNAVDKLIQVYQEVRKKFSPVEEDMWDETMNLGIIKGGEAPNKIPDYAEAVVDIRWTENFDQEKFLNEVKKLDAEFEIVEHGYMLNNDSNNKYMQLFKDCIEEQTGKPCLLLQEHGATDMRLFSERGIPAVVFGPSGAGYHGLGEYLDLNSLLPTYNALKEFVLRCSKQGSK